ncbi:MAG: hypothetical protein STSR0009_19470 [Methanoregula sp.]
MGVWLLDPMGGGGGVTGFFWVGGGPHPCLGTGAITPLPPKALLEKWGYGNKPYDLRLP